MPERQRPRVGEILVQAGVIDSQQLKAALGEQARWGRPLGATLIKLGMVDETELVQALAGQLELPMAKLEGKRIAEEVLALVPKAVATKSMVIPLFVKHVGRRSELYLGVEDPGNLEVFDDLAFLTGMEIKPVMVGPSELCEAIDRCYERTEEPESDPVADAPSSVVTPGTEELARHWSQASASAPASSPTEGEDRDHAQSPGDPVLATEEDASAAVTEPDHAAERATPAAVDRVERDRPAAPGDVPASLELRAVMELLIEKGVLTRQEVEGRMRDLALADADGG